MKTKIGLYLTLLITPFIINAQNHIGDYLVKSPDVNAFEAVNFAEINEYSGKVATSIPLFEFSIDGVKIPISIDYNSSGILVNEKASRVGLGWSLQAGGMVSKSIEGYDDFELDWSVGESGGATADAGWFTSANGASFGDFSGNITAVYTKMGYLQYCDPSNCTFEVDPNAKEKTPDIYMVRAPGLNTDFIHKRLGSIITPKEISPKGTIISTNIKNVGQDYAEIYQYTSLQRLYYTAEYNAGKTRDVQGINAISNSGLLYEFNDVEHLTNYTIIKHDGGFGPMRTKDFMHTSYPISRIYSQRTGQEVKFYYENVELLEFENYTDRITKRGKLNTFTTIEHQNNLWLKKIVKIAFDEGTINFHYDFDRLDIPGETALTEIEIKDLNGQIIKRVLFSYSYYVTPGSTSSKGKRLKLDRVYFKNKEEENLPGYNFTYNTTPLPERYSASADFSGYYNGACLLQDPTDFPTHYFYIDKNKSLLPFKILGDSNYYKIQGTYSLEADETYAKAGLLSQIQYPTGGKSVFDYELNSFEYLGQEVKGGGLRIKRNTLYDGNQTILRDINYEYKKLDGSTSGSIITLPKHATAELYDGDRITFFVISQYIDYSNLTKYNIPNKLLFKIANSSLNKLNYTKGNLVGYSRVKKEEVGNGYEIKEYTSPINTQDAYAPVRTAASGSWINAVKNWLQFQIDYGFFPTLSESNEIRRGNLSNHSVFNNIGQLLQRTKYTFNRTKIDSLQLGEGRNYSINCGIGFRSRSFIERNELHKTERYNYLNGGEMKNTESFVYDYFNGLLKEKSFLTSNQETKKTLFEYPKQNNPDNFIQNLFIQNRINKPIKKSNFINNTKIDETLISYNNYNGKTEPSLIEVFKGENTLGTPIVTFDSYDIKGNPIEYRTTDNIPISLLWGYNKTKIVSKIAGSTYNDLIATGIDFGVVDSTANEAELKVELNKLQDAFKNDPLKNVETYIHKPLIGVAQISDLRNQKVSYEYDNFNRFSLSKDHENNVLMNNEYNLANSQTYPTTISGFLEYEYLGNYEYKVTINASGGSGNYMYEWGSNCYSDFESSTSSNTYITSSNYQYPIPNANNFPCYDNAYRGIPVICKIRDIVENTEITRTIVLKRIIAIPPPIFYLSLELKGWKSIKANTRYGSGDFSFQWKENNGSYSSLSLIDTYSIVGMLECEDEGGSSRAITCRIVDNVTQEVLIRTISVYETVGCQG